MLEPALKYESQLQQLFLDRWYDPKYMYYNNYSWRDQFKVATNNWEYMEFVSTLNGEVIGYFNAKIDRDSLVVTNIGAVNFYDMNFVFAKDFAKFLRNLFDVFKFRKIRFTVNVGNPIEPTYDKLAIRYGGRIVGIWKAEDKLMDGTYSDRKLYEIMREDYLAAKNR